MANAATAAHVSTTPTTSSARSHPDCARPWSSVAAVSATERQSTVVKATRRPAGQRCSMRLRLPEGARDHEALDLVRALVDLRDLGVAQVALDRVLGHVA